MSAHVQVPNAGTPNGENPERIQYDTQTTEHNPERKNWILVLPHPLADLGLGKSMPATSQAIIGTDFG
jgi:hypothetical protein